MQSGKGTDEDVYAVLPKEVPSGEAEELKNKIETMLTERQDLIWENRRLARQLRQLGKKVKVPRDRRPGTAWDTPGWDPHEKAAETKVEVTTQKAAEPVDSKEAVDSEATGGEEDNEGDVIFTGPPVTKQQPQQPQQPEQPKQPQQPQQPKESQQSQPSSPSTPITMPPKTKPAERENVGAIAPEPEVMTKADLLWGSAGVGVIVCFFGFAMYRQRRRP